MLNPLYLRFCIMSVIYVETGFKSVVEVGLVEEEVAH